jgi:hypothetical protein
MSVNGNGWRRWLIGLGVALLAAAASYVLGPSQGEAPIPPPAAERGAAALDRFEALLAFASSAAVRRLRADVTP